MQKKKRYYFLKLFMKINLSVHSFMMNHLLFFVKTLKLNGNGFTMLSN